MRRALVLSIVLALSACATEPPPPPALKASVQLGPLSVTVANEDHQDWNNVRVRLSDRFMCPAEKIEAKKSATIALASCTSRDGARFVPLTMAPTNVVVTAVLTEDTGEAVARFTP